MNNVPMQYWKSDRIYPMSKFRMCITKVKEEEDGGEKTLKVVSQEWVQGNGKEFRESLFEDANRGIHREIKIVTEKPKEFAFNQIYMLATRDVVWIWVKDED